MKKREIGFTFIELIIALAIFSIIATSVYYTLYSGMELWSRGNRAINYNQRLRLFFSAVSSDLINMVPCSDMKSMESEWGAEKLSFPTLIGASYGMSAEKEIVKAVYYFDEKEETLKRSYAAAKDGFDEGFAEAIALLSGLEKAGFEYAYASPDGYAWKEEWDSSQALPRLVRIKCEFKRENGEKTKPFEKIVFIPIGDLGEEE